MLKFGVVGVGHLGQHHARIFKSIAGSQLVGIYDKNFDRAKEIADKNETTAFSSYEQLLDQIDAIDISATTSFHYNLAKTALEKGKHVFVEKPITATVEQGQELVDIAKSRNLIIQVGHIERFNPVVLEVEKEIDTPMFIESHRLAPFNPRGTDVPVVFDLMIHDIDLILCFVHSPLVDIRASGVGVLTPSIDIANARLEFANGAIANVTSSRVSMKRERKLRFFQKDAYISMDFQGQKASVLRKAEGLNKILPEILLGRTDFSPEDLVKMDMVDCSKPEKDALTMELESFVDAVTQNKTPIVSGEDGLRALEVAMRIMDKINANLKKL
ncbi:MAG TPA: Gfo/Idh/MocA family oxidoreductase [Candidatus Cloacimonadota bacterium]|nr:Gfo/Idh/MocA family oxidoreductase [Candidatus Cloacimonadota bacterium]HPT71422.1 Gfo/Idh/MocA family oxidoreductase [Candidatus Cloacimonadota bacterium]